MVASIIRGADAFTVVCCHRGISRVIVCREGVEEVLCIFKL